MLSARIRIGAAWNDVSILNISPRGLSMQASAPPPRGTYLEIRRGEHEIMACVMWARHHRFGVRTQDVLLVDDIIHQRSTAETAPAAAMPDRRPSWRTGERHETSRMMSRAMEFAIVAVFAASAAVVTFGIVAEALQQPLAEATAALSGS